MTAEPKWRCFCVVDLSDHHGSTVPAAFGKMRILAFVPALPSASPSTNTRSSLSAKPERGVPLIFNSPARANWGFPCQSKTTV